MAVLQRALFAGLVDDAALFPPGSAPMDKALAEHARHREAAYADLVGPFLCPASRLAEMRTHLGADRLDISVVLDVEPGESEAALADMATNERFRVVLVEARLAALGDSAAAVGAAVADRGVPGFLEVARGAVAEGLAVVAGTAWSGAKFRTGGTTATAFPGATELADFLVAVVDAGLPFKLTAGLHHAMRSTTPEGFEQHGVLGVLAATARAIDGGSADAVADVLEQRDAETVVAELRALDRAAVVEVRRRFRSFGCCGVTDPLDDLARLGLLDMP